MNITAGLTADLGVLTSALDEPGSDIANSLGQLESDVGAAISTYRGLSVSVADRDSPFTLTVLAPGADAGEVETSLRLELTVAGGFPATVVVILYAGSPGAFVDLAADLAWLTPGPLSNIILDRDLALPVEHRGAPRLCEASVVNQAIGALLGQGYSPEQAERRLAPVDAAGSRYAVAHRILADLAAPGSDPGV